MFVHRRAREAGSSPRALHPHRRALAAVALAIAAAACGGGGEGPDDGTSGSTSSSPTSSSNTTTTMVIYQTEETAQTLVGDLIVSGRFAGLAEVTEYREDIVGSRMIAEHDALGSTDCTAALPDPDPRLVRFHRVFSSASVPPAPDFAEVDQTTTVYATTATRTEWMRSSMDAVLACGRQVDEQHGTQITEGWAEAAVPAPVAAAGLEAEVITATMTVPSTGHVFPYAWGCVGRGPVLQCISVWTLDRAETDRYLSDALATTAQHLAEAGIPA